MFALIQNALTLGQSAAIVRSLIYQFNELSRVEGRLPRGGARPAALAIWYGMAGVQGFPLRVAGTFSGASPDSIEPVAFALMDRSERIEPGRARHPVFALGNADGSLPLVIYPRQPTSQNPAPPPPPPPPR